MMRFRNGLALALGATLVLSGCAGGAATGGGGPVTSPTGEAYPPGTPPEESDFSAAATLFVAQGQYQQALEQAQQGIAEDSANPIHYYLAGQAQLGLGNVEEGVELLEQAQEIYPAYELEVEPVREQYWAEFFNQGVEAYNAGNLEEAASAWDQANQVFPRRPEGFLNLGVIYTQQNEYDRAVEVYQQGLEAVDNEPATRELAPEEVTERAESRATLLQSLSQLLLMTERYGEAEELLRQQLEQDPDNVDLQSRLASAIAQQEGREAEAAEIYNQLLSNPNLSGTDLFNVGVALFNSQDFARAAEAFERATEVNPNSRDAWYNYANALYAGENFTDLVPVAERLVELDPLNENAALILARSYREAGQNNDALAALERNEQQPIHIQDLQLRPQAEQTTVTGRAVGNQAAAGTPVQLRFTFFGETGELGTETVTVTAPAADATTDFEVVFQGATPVTGYRYELVP